METQFNILPNIGLQVWLMTSRQTEPDLKFFRSNKSFIACRLCIRVLHTHTEHGKDQHRQEVRSSHFIDIWMIYLINKTYRWRFVRICIWQFDPDPPYASTVRTCHGSCKSSDLCEQNHPHAPKSSKLSKKEGHKTVVSFF